MALSLVGYVEELKVFFVILFVSFLPGMIYTCHSSPAFADWIGGIIDDAGLPANACTQCNCVYQNGYGKRLSYYYVMKNHVYLAKNEPESN